MSGAAVPEMVRRVAAAEATLRQYRGRRMTWSAGHTCVHMVRAHLRRMGHRPEPIPAFRSPTGARRALESRGWATTAEMMDAQPGLCRIAPAAMLPGDIGWRASPCGIGGLLLYCGHHKLAGWFEGYEEFVLMDMAVGQVEVAWRI